MLARLASTSTCRSPNLASISVRLVSSKYIRPHPRPYKRRWYEAAVAPVMPESRRTCPSMVEVKQKYEKERDEALRRLQDNDGYPSMSIDLRRLLMSGENAEYSDIEIALTNLVRSWMKREDFRVLAVCQFLPINGRTLWLTRNQLRLKGLEFRNYGNRIMRKVFEGTPLEALNVLFVGSNCTLFGKDIDAIQTIVTECDKIAWIVPLAIIYDCRILSMTEVRDLCKKKSFEEHRAETVSTISQIGEDVVSLTGHHLNDLTRTLDQIALRNEQKE